MLTVVVPAYNVGPYIARCVISILSQRPPDNSLRVIVVVDGATDNTLDEIRKSIVGHEDIVLIIEQINCGLSAARNAGLDSVETKYVTFLDGDDVWINGYVEKIWPILHEGDIDLIEYDAWRIDTDGRSLDLMKIASAPENVTMVISRDDFLTNFLCFAWARVYLTKLVRDHRYPTSRRFEDTATTPWHYWKSRRSLSVGTPLIGYRQRPQSILSTPRESDIGDIAANTRDAANMFIQTGDPYWSQVAHRSFHQGCRRIILLPVQTWLKNLAIIHDAIRDVPPLPGAIHWLKMRATPAYVAMLWIKSKFSYH